MQDFEFFTSYTEGKKKNSLDSQRRITWYFTSYSQRNVPFIMMNVTPVVKQVLNSHQAISIHIQFGIFSVRQYKI